MKLGCPWVKGLMMCTHRMSGTPNKAIFAGLFCAAIVLLGLSLCWITPPLQVMDEPVHFYRAYQVSEGKFLASRQGAQVGGVLPISIRNWVENIETQLYGGRIFGATNYIYHLWRPVMSMPLNQEMRRFTEFNSSAYYPPVIYVPQALGMAAARQFGVNLGVIFYAGRCANFLVYLLICGLALSMAPFHRWALALLAFMPMSLYHAASLNPDAMSIAVGILMWVMMLNLKWGDSAKQPWIWVGLFCVSLVSGLSKGYFFLLIPLLFLVSSGPKVKNNIFAAILVLSAYFATAIGWGQLNADLVQFSNPAVTPRLQWMHILSHPISFLKAFVWAWQLEYAIHYVRSFFGLLGWIHVHLPYWLLMTYAGVFIFALRTDGPTSFPISPVFRWACLVSGLIGVICIFVWLYLSYNPVGSPELRGVQGRYFIPLMPLFMLFLTPTQAPASSRTDSVSLCSMGIVLVSGATMVLILLRHYYRFM